jgi:hypothetical protein
MVAAFDGNLGGNLSSLLPKTFEGAVGSIPGILFVGTSRVCYRGLVSRPGSQPELSHTLETMHVPDIRRKFQNDFCLPI